MPYVMVPVPEEHVEEAMAAVLRIINRGRLVDWDAEAVASFFQGLDESSRTLLGTVSRATAAGKQLPQRVAADMTELTERELLGIMREINEQCTNDSRPPLMMNQAATETLPNGRVREVRVFTMDDQVAAYVRDAERADLQQQSHPLLGTDG